MGVDERVVVASGDFFVDGLPGGDVLVMGNVLHGWDDDQKQFLISKAYSSLNSGGRLIAIENVIDDARRENTFGLLMSLNMLIENPGGSDYTGAQFNEWCRLHRYRARSARRAIQRSHRLQMTPRPCPGTGTDPTSIDGEPADELEPAGDT